VHGRPRRRRLPRPNRLRRPRGWRPLQPPAAGRANRRRRLAAAPRAPPAPAPPPRRSRRDSHRPVADACSLSRHRPVGWGLAAPRDFGPSRLRASWAVRRRRCRV